MYIKTRTMSCRGPLRARIYQQYFRYEQKCNLKPIRKLFDVLKGLQTHKQRFLKHIFVYFLLSH